MNDLMNSFPATTRRWLRATARRLRRSERGLTLIELLVSMSMLIGILTGAMTLLVGMMQKQPGLSDRSEQVSEARIALERMVRELRPGYAVDSPTGTANTVSFRTYMRRTCAGVSTTTVTLCRVTYTCTASTKTCTRRIANPNGTSPTAPVPLITGVTNTNVFTIQGSYVGIRFVMPTEDGRGALTVTDGARLRNAPLGV
jgi:type II secretory pathway pseudopilin PulG